MATLAQLTTYIEAYTQNNDPTFLGQIPTFIKIAEKRIFADAKLPTVRRYSSGTSFSDGFKAYMLPGDYISMQSFACVVAATGEVVHLVEKSPDFISELYPLDSRKGRPKYWGHNNSSATQIGIIVGPVPDAAYATHMYYNGYPASITDGLVSVSSLTPGFTYVINTVGTTDFTTIGAANNNVGTAFVATGTGSGTGLAYLSSVGSSWLGDHFEHLLLYVSLVEAYVFMKGSEDILNRYINLVKLGFDELATFMKNSKLEGYR